MYLKKRNREAPEFPPGPIDESGSHSRLVCSLNNLAGDQGFLGRLPDERSVCLFDEAQIDIDERVPGLPSDERQRARRVLKRHKDGTISVGCANPGSATAPEFPLEKSLYVSWRHTKVYL